MIISVFNLHLQFTLKNTYNLPVTYMYRTTSLILDGIASGSGDRRGYSYRPILTWKGIANNITESQALRTTQFHADEFDLSGAATFAANGSMSLVIS